MKDILYKIIPISLVFCSILSSAGPTDKGSDETDERSRHRPFVDRRYCFLPTFLPTIYCQARTAIFIKPESIVFLAALGSQQAFL
jgi:hypothetical protein